jgi:hypothetical protein
MRKMKKLLALTICFMFIGVGSTFAEPLQKHTLELGPEISYITYKEPSIMKEEGMMYGISGSYAYHNKLMLKAEGRGSWGQVDYSSPISGSMDNINDYMLELRGLGGYDFSVSTASVITPYIGIGYRYLNDDMSGKVSSTGAAGYEREISYVYSPIGIEAITRLENRWSIGAILEYDYFWDGTVKSHMGAIPGYYDIESDQDKGYGLRGSVKFQKKSEKLDFAIEPFIRYWNIKKSKTTADPVGNLWIEPKNNSTEFGIKLAIMF